MNMKRTVYGVYEGKLIKLFRNEVGLLLKN